jgi:undecaprenyl-diphosphatase
MNLDLYFFNLINAFAGKWGWLDFLSIFFAKYFEYFLLVFLIILVSLNFKKYWVMTAEAIASGVIVRFGIVEIVRWLWFRPRPFVVENLIPLINKSASEASFPSGHASFYFAISTVIYLYNKKIGIVFYVATVLIAFFRVFVGVHWPSDIFAGALIGMLTAWIINKLFKKYLYKYI